MTDVRLLGVAEVRHDGVRIPLGTPKQQIVLGMLAVVPGRLVTMEDLVDELWPEAPPRSAVANVRTYAANLRRAFDTHPELHGSVARDGRGYRLLVEAEAVDVVRLRSQHARARELAREGHSEQALALVARAAEVERGVLLAGLTLGPSMFAVREAVEQERQSAVELRAELQISTGRPELAARLLRGRLPHQKVHEPARALLMRALIAMDDVAGAVAVYQATRQDLRSQLGVEPGAEIEQLHRAALAVRQGNRPASQVTTMSKSTTDPPSINWLPRAVPHFVGRGDVIARLMEDIERTSTTTSVVRVIDGMAGCGKTTLAVHLAGRLTPAYPDAQLFIDLRGHGEAPPLGPAAVLFTLLRQLGVPAGRIPSELDDRVDLWRRELSRRRVVIILDNATDNEQVGPLLPTRPGAVVLVTARNRLFTSEVGQPEPLSVLTPGEAVELLAVTAGAERVAAEPEAALEVVRRCGHLPLAIRLAGARLAHRRKWRVADLAHRLNVELGAISELAVAHQTVAGAFAASYEPLSERTKFAFRMLAIHPGGHFSVPMAAALTDFSLEETGRTIDDLVDRHLLEEAESGRYRLHDLMRQYATELSRQLDEAPTCDAAADRLLDLCLRVALDVAVQIQPTLADERLLWDLSPRPDLVAALGPPRTEWLEAESANLTAMVDFAANTGRDSHSWRLARALWRFCYLRSYFDDIIVTHRKGLAAAERAGDRVAVAGMRNYLASAYVRTGDYRTAQQLLEAAIATYTELGDRNEVIRFRANLSAVKWLKGELEAAVRLDEELLREERCRPGLRLGLVLPNMGLALTHLGRYEEALRAHRLHLHMARLHGDQFHQLNALAHIARVKVRLGRFDMAIRLLNASLMLRDRTGHRYGEAEARADLGAALRGLGRLDEARHQHELALRLALDHGERHIQGGALNELGVTTAAQGDPALAADYHRQALEVATRIGHPYEQGRALAALAGHLAATDPAQARRHWQRALAIFERIGVPEQADVRRRLALIEQLRADVA